MLRYITAVVFGLVSQLSVLAPAWAASVGEVPGGTLLGRVLGATKGPPVAIPLATVGLVPEVVGLTALKALAAGVFPFVLRQGYVGPGDGGGALYWWDNSGNCAAADDGAQVQPNAGTGCWQALSISGGADARVWGVIHDGTTDVTTRLQAAINWALLRYAYLNIKGSSVPYRVSATINIGNGTSSTLSTQNVMTLRSTGSGASESEWTTPPSGGATFQWVGGVSAVPMFKVAGPVAGVNITGITADCASKCATGFNFTHQISGNYEQLMVRNYTGPAYVVTSFPGAASITGLSVGARYSRFSGLKATSPTLGSGVFGITIGASTYTAGNYDVANMTFSDCEFEYDGIDAASAGIRLQFAEKITFTNVKSIPIGGVSGVGLKIVPPTGGGGGAFPREISFYGATLIGGANNPGAGWTAASGVGFFPYNIADGEALPVANTYGQYYGLASTGALFGLAKMGLAAGGTDADLSGTGGAHQFLKQSSVGADITVGQPAFTDISGLAGLAQGGTHTDLSATGGASRVLKQTIVGGDIAVAQLAFTDITGVATVAQGAVPQGAMTTFVPTVTCGTGGPTPTTYTIAGRYMLVAPKLAFVEYQVSITTSGTCATDLTVSVPGGLTPQNYGYALQGKCNGFSVIGMATATGILINKYDGAYPGVDGATVVLSGLYEAQ